MNKAPSRRDVLVTGSLPIVLMTSGCIDQLPGIGDSGAAALGSSREKIIDSEEPVAKDKSVIFTFALGREATLEYEFTVNQGPPIEIFVLDSKQFESFQAGNHFDPLSHETGPGGSDTIELQEGSYRLVIDNSMKGDLEPPENSDNDSAEVEIKSWVEH